MKSLGKYAHEDRWMQVNPKIYRHSPGAESFQNTAQCALPICEPPLANGLLLGLARAPEGTTRFGAGVLAVSKDLYTVDKNMFDADGILLRLLVGGHIGNRIRIKDDDIGKHTRLQETAMIESKIRSRKTR